MKWNLEWNNYIKRSKSGIIYECLICNHKLFNLSAIKFHIMKAHFNDESKENKLSVFYKDKEIKSRKLKSDIIKERFGK